MIAWLNGVLRFRDADRLVLDVQGVGYEVRVAAGVAAQVNVGDPLELFIHTHVREDQLTLFGFDRSDQLETFLLLMGINGVGPRLATTILGGISPEELAVAIEAGDLARLTSLSGVGKRMAQRLVTELGGKMSVLSLPGDSGAVGGAITGKWSDLVSALSNLGFRPKEVANVVSRLQKEHADAALDELIRMALNMLSS